MIAICLWIFFCAFVGVGQSTSCQKCRNHRVHNMQGADCYDSDLREVPQCLSTSIEVLDLSYNRIRKIKKEDMDKYSNVKYLYLTDNKITNIEEESFSQLPYLEVLEISYNPLLKIPQSIFHLPSLTRLYINEIQEIDIIYEIEKAKPITSPLMKFEIAYNDIRELPDLGTLPTLSFYNVSGNKNVLVKPSHFAGLCMLKNIDMDQFTANFESDCDCINIQKWLQIREVVIFGNFTCKSINDCPYEIPQKDLETYSSCLETNQTKTLHSILLKIVLPACLIILLVISIVVYVCWRKINKRYSQESSIEQKANRPLCKTQNIYN